MESLTKEQQTAFESTKKQYTPINLKPFYIYGRFPILPFMATLGIGAYVASVFYDIFFKNIG